MRKIVLLLDLRSEFGGLRLQLTQAELRRIQAARDLRVDIAARESADGHRDHDPVSDTGDTCEFEGRMVGDDNGSS